VARTKRTQILMEPQEFRRLRALARQRKTSIGDLIRLAIRQTYFSVADKKAIVEAIVNMNLPVIEWDEAKKEIEAAHTEPHAHIP